MENTFIEWLAPLRSIADTGGSVVILLMVVAVLTLAVLLYKLWQFTAVGVGRHKALAASVASWDAQDRAAAQEHLLRSTSYLAPVVAQAMIGDGTNKDRLRAEAEALFGQLERGFRLLDSVAQLAPLLGLFGTVLGMIDAFKALQEAGSQVDPSILAGGIWVALLTKAAGLVVAMPTALALSWLEGRMDAERTFSEKALLTVLSPTGKKDTLEADMELAHA